MIFPKRTNEGGGLRMAAMELDLAGGRMANRVAQSWKMRLCSRVLFSSLPFPAHAAMLFQPSFPLSLSILRKYVSIYICARDHVIPCDRIIPECTGRSLPEMQLTGPCGFVRTIRKNIAREERSCIFRYQRDFGSDRQYLSRNGRMIGESDK